MTPLTTLTTDQLAERICLRAGQIAAAEAEQLAWIAEFDRREGWAGPGMLSCAHWLSWRIGLSGGAARERVRVARRLEDLPVVAAAFGEGRLSYSKVRAITRVAQSDDGIDWVLLGRSSSASQLEKLVRGVERVRTAEAAEDDPELMAWRLRTSVRYDGRGGFTMTVSGPAAFAPVLRAGLDAQRQRLARRQATSSDVSAETPSPTDADALLSLAQDALAAERADRPDLARRRRPQLTPQVDPLSGWARQADGELLPPSSLRQLVRSLPGPGGPPVLRPGTAADLRRFDLGRSTRVVSERLRGLLGVVDGERCRFPGCTRHRRLHAHHVRFWSRGGGTDLGNLVLLCSRHHTVVHAQGFQLLLHPDRRLDVRTAGGVPVLHHPAPPWGDPAELDEDQRVSAETLPPDHGTGRLDLRYAVSVLLAQAA